MFASKSIGEHLLRGIAGSGALALGVVSATAHPWALLLALPVAIVAFRGCPTCWTIGLVETLARRLRGDDSACVACENARQRSTDHGRHAEHLS